MPEIAIIGGTGMTSLDSLEILHREMVQTPYGEPSGPLTHGRLCGRDVLFLARHGYGHTIPPHKVNYRANLWALKESGVENIISIAAVGSIRKDFVPGSLVLPDQIIDYTWSRDNTFFEDGLKGVTHIDFTWPYCLEMREKLSEAAALAHIELPTTATYGAVQGPRLETAAEINRMERDGCDLVGMTGMPETALARELELCYASCAVVANMAAGRGHGQISLVDIEDNLIIGMKKVDRLLEAVTPLL
jgi:5'-deoxy-5'-methylthioadenosine phosphorylase